MTRLRSRALWLLMRRLAERTGHELVARNYYSPLPDLERLPPGLWSGTREIRGVDLRLEAAVGLLEELAPFLREFQPPLDAPTTTSRFFVRNGAYESVDAEILYALLRHHKPARVVELGSGASSHVIWAAQLANQADGRPFQHSIFDPFPFTANPIGPLDGPATACVRAELIDSRALTPLARDDVLFVDTTHTVKTGGDVTRILLDLVPQLASGVLVHVHDIFLPDEYPREWVIQQRRAWAEQYLLQAFLAFNGSFEVVFPAHAVARAVPSRVAELIPSFAGGAMPGAFWMRRLG